MDSVTPADSGETLRFAELRRARAMIENPLETAAEAYCVRRRARWNHLVPRANRGATIYWGLATSSMQYCVAAVAQRDRRFFDR